MASISRSAWIGLKPTCELANLLRLQASYNLQICHLLIASNDDCQTIKLEP
jgi:hypothetical protein